MTVRVVEPGPVTLAPLTPPLATPPLATPPQGTPLQGTPPTAVAPVDALAVDPIRAAAARVARIGELHLAFLRTQAAVRAHAIRASLPFAGDPPPVDAPPAELPVPVLAPVPPPVPVLAPAHGSSTRPWLDRAALEALASGPIHQTFGPAFTSLAGYRRVVRMPQPPLLLADRVVSITGEPMSLGVGSVVTETDVVDDAWYLHDGHLPAGLMVEAGQADLLLVSWLGVDQLNRGERVYRLLGCDLTAHGPLPRPGETLRYDITVERHANLGDLRLFFFRYDCTVDGALRMSVRNGQAGFFTDAELQATGGVVEHPAGEALAPADPYPRAPRPGPLPPAAVTRFAAGDPYGAFGDGFERGASHTASPRIGAGRLQLVERVDALEPAGGPWGRGYLRATLPLSDDAWFFRGHFKDDPCMPGTLMFEGALQAMALFLGAAGATLDRDGWRFEPLTEHPYRLRCRGQAVPGSRELVYEVFVRGYRGGERPALYADLMGSVDGVRAFHCAHMALALVPDFPVSDAALRREARPDPRAVTVDGHVFDAPSLLACAVGRPSAAFGPLYAPFDGGRPVPRLPGPPFQFVTRVVAVDGPIGGMRVGTAVTTEVEISEGSWLFTEGGPVPVSAWMEIALQPCGWLASYVGCTRTTEAALAFRNLDGAGEWVRSWAGPGVLTVRARLTSLVRNGGLILVSFESAVDDDAGTLFRCTTSFGFFPPAALQDQVGLDRPRLELPPVHRPLARSGRLGLLDAVTGHDPARAALRTELAVDPRAWFFRAHFFQDPVQPGSLGVELMLRSLVELVVAQGWSDRSGCAPGPAEGHALTWKYRGQVTPEARRVEVELVADPPADGVVRGEATLWVDGRCIYHVSGLAVRVHPPVAAVRVVEIDGAHPRAVALFCGRPAPGPAGPAPGVTLDGADPGAAVEAALRLPPGVVGHLVADGVRLAVRSDPGPGLARLSLGPATEVGFTAPPSLAGVVEAALAAHHGFVPGLRPRPWIEARRRAVAGGVTVEVEPDSHPRPPLVATPAIPFAVAADDVEGLLAGLDALVAELADGTPDSVARRRLTERRSRRLAVVVVARDRSELVAEVERARGAVRAGRRWRTPAGSAYEPEPVGPEAPVAFTYPGMGAAVPGHGVGWLTQLPAVGARLGPVGRSRVAAALVDRPSGPAALATTTVAQSVVGTGVAQALGLAPRFALGYSVGECAMVAALGVWPDLAALDRALGGAAVFEQRLGGPMTAVAARWGVRPDWSHVQLACSADRAREALAGEAHVYLATVDTARSVSIAGQRDAVDRVAARAGVTALPVGVALAIHGDVARTEFAAITELYTRPVEGRPVTLLGGLYDEEIPQVPVELGRALAHGLARPVDLPRRVLRAWALGARVFVDPGPRATLARWVSDILGDLPHAAIALAGETDDDHRPLVRAVAALVAHGVQVDPDVAVPAGLRWGARAAEEPLDLGVLRSALGVVAPALDVDGLDPDDPLPLDSLARVELRGILRDTYGVDVPMERVLGDATPRALSRWTAAPDPVEAPNPPNGRSPRTDSSAWEAAGHPATTVQLDMWRMNGRLPPGVDPGEFHRTVPVLWTHARIPIRGPLDPDRMADAIRATWARWPILGSVLREGRVEPWGAVPVERLGPGADPAGFFRAGVDPELGPPGRLAVVSVGPERWEVWIVHHHLFVDGLSAVALWQQILARYAHLPDRERPPFAAAAATAERWLRSPDSAAARAHWEAELDGAPQIPLGGGDPTAAWTEGARVPVQVTPEQLRAIDVASRGASRFAVVLALFARALRVCTGAADLPLVTFHANRDLPGFPGAFDVVGPLAGPLPLRCRGWLDAPLAERVAAAQALFVRSLAHAHATPSVLALAPAVSVVLQSFAPEGATQVGPLEIDPPVPVGVGEGLVGLELELVLWPRGDGLGGSLAYAKAAVSAARADQLAAQWGAELDALVHSTRSG
ncbi:MAG: condensation domain-containing protein [Myxococcota bacterium]